MQINGKPPTIREIGDAMQVRSTGQIDYHLNRLEAEELIIRVRRQSRGVVLTQPIGIPIKGRIAAGLPIENYANPDQVLDIGHKLARQNTYALEVEGDSMIGDAICNGDYVVIRPQPSCQNGEIIVAVHRLEENKSSATLKRIFQEHNQVRLQPANSTMEPIYISKQEWDAEWEIQGKVVAIFRQYPTG
jgi:repressor LexA